MAGWVVAGGLAVLLVAVLRDNDRREQALMRWILGEPARAFRDMTRVAQMSAAATERKRKGWRE